MLTADEFYQLIKHAKPGTPHNQCYKLAQYITPDDETSYCIEIGSFMGRASLYMGIAMRRGLLITIDPYSGMSNHSIRADQSTKEQFFTNMKLLEVAEPDIWHYHIENVSCAPETIAELNSVIDYGNNLNYNLIFVDGKHTGDDPRNDFDQYSPLCPIGGYFAMHDYCHKFPRVMEVINLAISGRYPKWRIADTEGVLVILQRTGL
jgi:hypothetical protein